MVDELVRTLSADGSLAARALVATELVNEAATRHGSAPTASAALGRTLMGAVLLAAGTVDGERVQVHFRGNGPIRSLLAISSNRGEVRGLVGNATAHLPSRNGKLDVGGVVGSGTLAVVRSHPTWHEPYSGHVPIVSGEIAEDLARYLAESEQTPSVIALGVFVASDGSVQAAGGFLVHAMPDAPEEAVAMLESNVHHLPSPSELVHGGCRPDDILDKLLHGLGCSDRQRLQPVFYCPCDRDRILGAVLAMGRDEMRDIIKRGKDLEVRCEFCCDRYVVSQSEVVTLLKDA
jgi:molecular chaperone Hsp33